MKNAEGAERPGSGGSGQDGKAEVKTVTVGWGQEDMIFPPKKPATTPLPPKRKKSYFFVDHP